ncbi:cell division protein FtsL [Enterococcus sp. LJL120]
MAEPKKVEDFQYQMLQEPAREHEVPETPAVPEITEVQPVDISEKLPVSSLRHLKRLSKMEKFILGFILVGILGMSILTIRLQGQMTQVENQISTIEATITETNGQATELEQQKTELSRSDRLKSIAEANGLTINENNLRTVK